MPPDLAGGLSSHMGDKRTLQTLPVGVRKALDVERDLTPLAERERITFAGDWHGNDRWAGHVLKRARSAGAQVVLQLGDFGVWPGQAGQRYLDMVSWHAMRLGVSVLFVDGNHEDFTQLEQFPIGVHGMRCVRPGVWHLPRGFRFTWGGLTFAALGGATSLDRPRRTPFIDWWPGEEITWADAQATVDGGQVDVLLTHDCPTGVDIPGLPPASIWPADELARANAHRGLLRQVVDAVAPTALYHGHFHSRYDAELGLDSGLRVAVHGLDCDGSMTRGYVTVELSDLVVDNALRRDAAAA